MVPPAASEGKPAGVDKDIPLCSVFRGISPLPSFTFCEIKPSGNQGAEHPIEIPKDVTISLTAMTSEIEVAGYRVTTHNYNGFYLPPLVELNPGDTLNVRLTNALTPLATDEAAHADDAGHEHKPHAATNLHTHGLIVDAKNRKDEDVARGNGDNIFVSLIRADWLDYKIKIPTDLKESVLCKRKLTEPVSMCPTGKMEHPTGLYWYHSHLHGISAAQVSGGMSGLMSIGDPEVNLVALDKTLAVRQEKTTQLHEDTDVSYIMLRDIELKSATAPPDANGSPAEWIVRNPFTEPLSNLCYPDPKNPKPPSGGKGYCQSPTDSSRFWLFTVNGQLYPTIKVGAKRNALLRIANISANVSYQLHIRKIGGKELLPFRLLNVDGVVPTPLTGVAEPNNSQTEPVKLKLLTLMPAARAEILLENSDPQGGGWELKTCEQHTNVAPTIEDREDCAVLDSAEIAQAGQGDHWPEIALAKVQFAPSAVLPTPALLALNIPKTSPAIAAPSAAPAAPPELPDGCLKDIEPGKFQYREVRFKGEPGNWKIKTQVKERGKSDPIEPTEFHHFHDYVKGGVVDWRLKQEGTPKHTCVRLANGDGQLWLLRNDTGELHNFHIHQIKFRLATCEELTAYGLEAHCRTKIENGANSQFNSIQAEDTDRVLTWHDTIPVPADGKGVGIVLNFVDNQQVGKFVYHCHILKHEDAGLMAPMEVVE